MIWLTIVLALFLFYRFVERKHKVIVFLSVGALLLLVGIGIGLLYAYSSYRDWKMSHDISIRFVARHPVTDIIPTEVIDLLTHAAPELLAEPTDAEKKTLDQKLFSGPFVTLAHNRHLPQGVLNFRLDHSDREKTLAKLKPWERAQMLQAIEKAETSNPGPWIISFEICNKNAAKQLNQYWFKVVGFEAGRSTANRILEDGSYSDSTQFKGDLIVQPNTCGTFNWTGNYKNYDRYQVKDVQGVWQD